MSITMRDIGVAETRWREVQTSVDVIGQAMRAWDQGIRDQLAEVTRSWNQSYSAQLSGLANVQLRSAAIGQVLDAWNHGVRSQLADLRRAHTITHTIGQALDAWNQSIRDQLASIGRITYATDTIRLTLDTLDQAIRDQNPDLILADMQSDAVGQAIPGLERPPAAQIAVRAVVLTVFILLAAALWEETKDRPAEAIKGIIELVALWYALDLWIWRRLS